MVRKSRFETAPLGAKNREEVARYSDNPYISLLYGSGARTSASDALCPILYPSDELILEKGGASALNVYTRLQYDAVVQSALSRLMQEVISREVIIEPYSDKPGDLVVAKYVENQIKKIDIDEIYKGLGAESLITGPAYGEIIWTRTRKGIIVEDVRLRDPRRFRWGENPKVKGGFELRLLTRNSRYSGDVVPKRKFIAHRHWVSNLGDPYGSGLGRILYPLVKFRRRAIESEILYSDRFANPTAVVTAPLTALDEEIDELYSHLTNLSQENALILPEGYKFEFIGANQGGKSFPSIREAIDQEIHILITGEAESGNPDAGSRASSEVAASVRIVRASEMSQAISKTLRNTLIRWIVDLNFGVNVPAPYIKRDFRLEKGSQLTINDLTLMKEKLRLEATRDWVKSTFKVDLIPEEEMNADPEDSKMIAEEGEDIFQSIFGTETEEEEEEGDVEVS